jgi:hypothetical protein
MPNLRRQIIRLAASLALGAPSNPSPAQVGRVLHVTEQATPHDMTQLSEITGFRVGPNERAATFRLPGAFIVRVEGENRCLQNACLTFIIGEAGPSRPYTTILAYSEFYLSDSSYSALGEGPNLGFLYDNPRETQVHVGRHFVIAW